MIKTADDYVNQDQHIPVQDDIKNVEDPVDEVMAKFDEQLGRDENEAIDCSNIINERTRQATSQTDNGYNTVLSEEDLL